ncbi:hypothetical protein [Frigoriglobus tundricola]|uniref:Uncharacterized protein n=1 Tax=Frigoriglobus tundricola TaxID=2774151 RepID=A0A6M5Z2P3_9BACT|nr:hypothetical protein [Frigoriglobus tundricola]QJX00690.1 hypothetical protein FTUN_8322 [Frigoriglobus tundricola]
MNRVRWCAVVISLTFTSMILAQKPDNKLPDAVVKALEKADALEVYSLGGQTTEVNGWHGAKVLGQTKVKSAADLTSMTAALKKGVADGDGGARCFIPRHGVRVAHAGKTYDFLICFECHWVYVFTDNSDKPLVLMIADAPQKAFNKLLTDAAVPLAPPKK